MGRLSRRQDTVNAQLLFPLLLARLASKIALFPAGQNKIDKTMSTDDQKVRVIVFPGVQNLPSFAAEEQGFFAKRGLAVETVYTQSSKQQRDGLADGLYEIAHSAIDNAIAMVDAAGKDVVIVIGLD